MSNFDLLSEFDFETTFSKCEGLACDLLGSLCKICFGSDLRSDKKQMVKFLHQRLLAILAISSYSRSQKVNVFQRILGKGSKQLLLLFHGILQTRGKGFTPYP